jgi:hypothetical protein
MKGRQPIKKSKKMEGDLDILFQPLPDLAEIQTSKSMDKPTKKTDVKPKKKKDTPKPKKIKKQTKMVERTRPICKFYQEGRCSNDTCGFLHEGPLNKKENEICKYHLVGACQKGENCIYSHDFSTFPCKYFHLENECRDKLCRFSHSAISEEKKMELIKIYTPDAIKGVIPENPFKKTVF